MKEKTNYIQYNKETIPVRTQLNKRVRGSVEPSATPRSSIGAYTGAYIQLSRALGYVFLYSHPEPHHGRRKEHPYEAHQEDGIFIK